MSKLIERTVIIIVCVCTLTLIAVNLLREFQVTDVLSDNTILNGVYYKQSEIYAQPQTITISMSGCDKNDLLLNGAPISDIQDENEYVSIEVFNGDVLSVDLRKHEGEAIINVSRVTKDISFPLEGSKIFVENGIRTLFTVECK